MNELDRIALVHVGPTLELTMSFIFHSLLEADATGDRELKARLAEIVERCDTEWIAIKMLATPSVA